MPARASRRRLLCAGGAKRGAARASNGRETRLRERDSSDPRAVACSRVALRPAQVVLVQITLERLCVSVPAAFLKSADSRGGGHGHGHSHGRTASRGQVVIQLAEALGGYPALAATA